MSSFQCFLCHSLVNSDTTEETRDKYREVVGMHLCPDSHLCHICCHILHKLCLFRALCLKRSLEYPVMFSEKGTINLLRSDLDMLVICSEESCKPTPYRSLYSYFNTKTFTYNFNDIEENCKPELNQYVDLVKDRNDFDNISNHSNALDNTYENYEDYQHEEEYLYENESKDCGSCSEEPVTDGADEVNLQNELETENKVKDHDSSINNESTKDLENEGKLSPKTKKKKKDKTKKVKKRSFTKIVLSFKEQKAVLEAQRKEKKYLEAEFKCYNCALGFLFKDTYQSHMVRHEESNGQFSCPVCGLRFATQNAKCMHVILHSEVHRCNNCGVEVKRPHKNRHGRECWQRSQSATCHLCGNLFKDGNCLQQHLKRFHAAKTSKKLYSCSVCAKTYKEQAAVRTHMLKHINRRFNCDQCPSSFTSPYTLTQHKKRHTAPQEPLYCRACDSWYDTRKSLNAHLTSTQRHRQESCITQSVKSTSPRRVRPPRPAPPSAQYTCHLCGHQAKTLSKLKRHIKEVCERLKLEEQLAFYYEQNAMDNPI